MSSRAILVLLAVSVLLATTGLLAQAPKTVTSPEKFFGFQMGADRKMARWDKMVDYYKQLADESSRIKVVDMGPSTMGNPFLLVVISSPANLAKLDRLRQVNLQAQRPARPGRGRGQEARRRGQGGHLPVDEPARHRDRRHADGRRSWPTTWLTRQDEETQRILDNVVFLMVPSFNPDGEIMVNDWYQKTLGTEYEGSAPPWLYHKYAGPRQQPRRVHDQPGRVAVHGEDPVHRLEARRPTSITTTWARYGARIYVPPYADPIRPMADPLVWRELSWYGAHIAYKEEEAGLSGVLNDAEYSGWGHFGFHWITPFHNIAGMLTESASAKLATPIFIHPDQLAGRRPQPAGLRGADQLPRPVAGRLVAAARHRGPPEDGGVGHARPRGAQQGDRALERLPQGEAADRARRRGEAGRLRHSAAAARPADRVEARRQAARAGRRGPRGRQAVHRLERHGVRGRQLRRADGAAQDGAGPLPPRPDASIPTTRTRATATARRSGPTTWPPTRWPSSWACASTRWTRCRAGEIRTVSADQVPRPRREERRSATSSTGGENDASRPSTCCSTRASPSGAWTSRRPALRTGDFLVAAGAPDALLPTIATETGVGFAALEGRPEGRACTT